MAIPQTTYWPIDPHTRAKHVMLRKYLDAWLPKITKWHRRVIFCDGFAGPGIYSGGEDGSPMIALNAFLAHSHQERITSEIVYLFIEEDRKRYESLVRVLNGIKPELPNNVAIHHVNDKYDTAFSELLDLIDEKDSSIAPTLAFIDPFGVKGLPLYTIARLMKHRGCEVFITFMTSSLIRFVRTPQFARHCDDLFGCQDWRAARGMDGYERERFLRALYQARLEDKDTGVGAKYVRFFTMKDKKNKSIYDLFFATNHRKGIDAMKDAMWKVDQTGEHEFSDATNPDQIVLFSPEPDWNRLIDNLNSQFKGRTAYWPEIEEAIRTSPFRIRKTPLKEAAKVPNPKLIIHYAPGTHAIDSIYFP